MERTKYGSMKDTKKTMTIEDFTIKSWGRITLNEDIYGSVRVEDFELADGGKFVDFLPVIIKGANQVIADAISVEEGDKFADQRAEIESKVARVNQKLNDLDESLDIITEAPNSDDTGTPTIDSYQDMTNYESPTMGKLDTLEQGQ